MVRTWGATTKNKDGLSHYERNKSYYVEKARLRKLRNLEYIENLKKSGQCVDCGNKDIRVLDFDHLPEFTKSRNVSTGARRSWSIKRLDDEISKCQIRCANCHRIKTWDRKHASLA